VRRALVALTVLVLSACSPEEYPAVTSPELLHAAEEARAAVQVGLDALPAVVEVSDQYDQASACEEPPDEGPDGRQQWTVSRRVFLRQGADVEAALDAVRAAYPAGGGWRQRFDKAQPAEHRVQLARGELVVTVAVGKDATAPQVVISSATACYRNRRQ
jgi:hypothetical protein